MIEDHKVTEGECLSNIAHARGFSVDALWKHSCNSELREKRTNPHVLHPGDVVKIPPRRTKRVQAGTGRVHRYRVMGIPERIHLIFEDAQGQPRKGVPYSLTVGEQVHEGTTNDDGAIRHFIPVEVTMATVVLDGVRHALQLGSLAPVTEPEGLKARLCALGYLPASALDPDAIVNYGLALARFQEEEELEATGEFDAATAAALITRYGC